MARSSKFRIAASAVIFLLDFVWSKPPDPPIPQGKYFEFSEGSTLIFSHKKKKFLKGTWAATSKTLHLQVLDSRRPKEMQVELLGKIFSKERGALLEEALFRFRITQRNVNFEKKTVWIQTSTGTDKGLEREPPVTLARFPLRAGEEAGEYQVRSLQASVETSTGTFRHCLEIQNAFERMVFAPYVGLIQWKKFDEEWMLKEIRESRPDFSSVRVSTESAAFFRDRPVEEKDLSQISELAKQFCGKAALKFDKILSVDLDPANPALARVRFLSHRPDPRDSRLKNFEVNERVWMRDNFAGQVHWGQGGQAE